MGECGYGAARFPGLATGFAPRMVNAPHMGDMGDMVVWLCGCVSVAAWLA